MLGRMVSVLKSLTLFLCQQLISVARSVKQKIADFGWTVPPHPPYSPELSPTDYHLFLSMSNSLSGKKFTTVAEVKSAVKKFFDEKTSGFYVRGIAKLPDRWMKVVKCDGKYFE